MFRRMRNRIRMAALTSWDSTFAQLDLDLTEEDILRDLVTVHPDHDSAIEMSSGASA